MRVPLDQIVVVNRHRQEMGDIAELAASIRKLGLLHPVVVTPNTEGYRLVAGARRIEAVKHIGMDEIPVTVVTTLADARDLLLAERDENTCRKDFIPSEAVALGLELERLERPNAEARKATAIRARDDRGRAISAGHSTRDDSPTSGRTFEVVAPAVGMKPSRYAHAKSVVIAAESDPDPEVRQIAQEAVKEMDATGKVHGPYKRVIEARENGGVDKSREAVRARETKLCSMAAEGHNASQIANELAITESAVGQIAKRLDVEIIADKLMGKVRRIDPNRVMEETVLSLHSQAASLSIMKGRWDDLDPERVEEWAISLSKSLQALNSFCKQLKEKAHARH